MLQGIIPHPPPMHARRAKMSGGTPPSPERRSLLGAPPPLAGHNIKFTSNAAERLRGHFMALSKCIQKKKTSGVGLGGGTERGQERSLGGGKRCLKRKGCKKGCERTRERENGAGEERKGRVEGWTGKDIAAGEESPTRFFSPLLPGQHPASLISTRFSHCLGACERRKQLQ